MAGGVERNLEVNLFRKYEKTSEMSKSASHSSRVMLRCRGVASSSIC